MALSERQLLSAPHRVLFAGWETTTSRMQQAGWKLAAHEDLYGSRIGIAAHFPPAGLYMLAETQEYDFFRADRRPITFVVRNCSSHMNVQVMAETMNYAPIDACPQFTVRSGEIADYNIFAAPLVRTQEIIVEPKDVAECLAWAQKLQSKPLADIRERQRRRERNEAMQQDVFHAQILSLAA